MRDRSHDEAMAEIFREDPNYAIDLANSLLENGNQAELLIVLRQMRGIKPPVVPTFVREAVARMRAAPRFLSQEEWDILESYEGPVVSGYPEGRVPDKLEDDSNV